MGAKLTWRGSSGHLRGLSQHSEKKLRNDSESDVGACTSYKRRKHPEKRKKQEPTENQKNTTYQNVR